MKLFLVSVSCYTKPPIVPLHGTPTPDGTGRCIKCCYVYGDKEPARCLCPSATPVIDDRKYYHGVGWAFGDTWEETKEAVTKQVMNDKPLLGGWADHKIQGIAVPDDVIRQAYLELTAPQDMTPGDVAATVEAPALVLDGSPQPEPSMLPLEFSDTQRAMDAIGRTPDETLTPPNG